MRRIGVVALATLAAAALAACTESQLRMSPDFGEAVTTNARAQVADPDAHYAGTPDAASDGVRTAGAQTRYQKDAVIPPASTSTSTAVSSASSAGGAAPQ